MANEITTTTLDDLTHGYLIGPVLIAALCEQPGYAIRFCREFSLIGKPTNALQIPTETAYWGSANDRGAGVATAFNATQATALSNTAVSSGNVTCTCAEYGVAAALTDNVQEDSVDGIDLMNLFTNQMLKVLTLAIDDDYMALFPSLSQSVGTTNTGVTIAQMVAAQQGLRTRGAIADAVAYLLGNVTSGYVETALLATNAAAAVYALSADRLINYAPTPDNGMSGNRQVMTFRGAPVFTTGLTDTINAAADEASACICPSTAVNDASGATTHGLTWKRMPRFETQRQAKLRAWDLVMTARAGVVELQDGSGTQIVSKAS
jgi:hypothetical protein